MEKKHYEIQLLKNKMNLNILKMTNHPPSPESDQLNHFYTNNAEKK